MEVELASASSGLKPFSLKIKLTDKWLAKKAPSQLVALFLKHYDAKFGGASRAGDYVLGARGAPGSLDEAKPLRCGVCKRASYCTAKCQKEVTNGTFKRNGADLVDFFETRSRLY